MVETIPLYIFAGQSNAVGLTPTGHVAPLPEQVRLVKSNTNGLDTIGPEYGFAEVLSAESNGPFVILKSAWSNTALEANDGLDWAPESQGELFDKMIADYAALVTDYAAQGITVDVKGLFWIQGESDGFNTAAAAKYQANLSGFIEAVRAEMGALPVYVAQTAPIEMLGEAGQQVRVAQSNVSDQQTDVYLVDTTGLPQQDALHFSTEGLMTLGEDMAEYYLTGSVVQDQIVGDSGDNLLTGTVGDDTLFGGHGDDTMQGGVGSDSYIIGAGFDVIIEDTGHGSESDQFIFDVANARSTGGVDRAAIKGYSAGDEILIQFNDQYLGEMFVDVRQVNPAQIGATSISSSIMTTAVKVTQGEVLMGEFYLYDFAVSHWRFTVDARDGDTLAAIELHLDGMFV